RDGERAVHAAAPEARESVAHPPRPHVERSPVTGGRADGRSGGRCSRPRLRTTRPPVRPSAVFALLLAACAAPRDEVIALAGATLISGSGGTPVKDALLLVKAGHIAAVARVNELEVPRGAIVLSLVGKTIIPGLIDSHAHVERWAIERYLAWGVTTVRDLGATSTDSAIALKNDFDLGSVLGPRMLTSGAMIDGAPPTYATATAVRTAPEVRRAVDLRAVAGADHVKIYTKFTADLLRPLLDEATTLRLPVAAHLGKIEIGRAH